MLPEGKLSEEYRRTLYTTVCNSSINLKYYLKFNKE